jgi:hypothetical protein
MAVWIWAEAPAIGDGGSARDKAVGRGTVLVFAMFAAKRLLGRCFAVFFSQHKSVCIVSIEAHYAKREKRLFPV